MVCNAFGFSAAVGPGTYSTNDANSLMGELTKKAVLVCILLNSLLLRMCFRAYAC